GAAIARRWPGGGAPAAADLFAAAAAGVPAAIAVRDSVCAHLAAAVVHLVLTVGGAGVGFGGGLAAAGGAGGAGHPPAVGGAGEGLTVAAVTRARPAGDRPACGYAGRRHRGRAGGARPSGMSSSLAIVGGAPGDIVIVDGVIDAGPPAPGCAVLDASGGFVAPGFIDVQVNGAHGVDLASRPEAINDVAAGPP